MPTKTAKKKTASSAKSAKSTSRKPRTATTTNRKKTTKTPKPKTTAAKKTSTPKEKPEKKVIAIEPVEEKVEVPVIIEKAPEIILETKTTIETPEVIEQAVEDVTRMSVPAPSSTRKSIDMTVVNERMRERSQAEEKLQEPPKPQASAQEIKERAIKEAMYTANTGIPQKGKTRARRNTYRVHFGFRRVVLALACAAAAVFAIVYFVNLNAPDITLKVAAMQTGIDAKYPSYVPRDFALSDITSENGKITLNFRNSTTGAAYSIIEEKSSWDSNALYTNYVLDAYGEDATTVKEQGLTMYISGSDAAWANGGVIYKLKMTSGSLTKKQIKAIAVSL